MKEIILACGSKTQVSDEDFLYLKQSNWCLHGQSEDAKYAKRHPGIFMHHQVVLRMGLTIPDDMEVDHKDRDSLNNQRSNLRIVSKSVNNRNVVNPLNTSGHNGVDYNKKLRKWRARVSRNKVRFLVGYFNTVEEAVAAKVTAEKRHG